MTTTIHGIAIESPPSFAQQPMPDGDTADGYVLAMDPATNKFKFQRTHLACGPSSLGQNVALVGRRNNFLYGAVGQYGMRSGLAAYVPPGVWELWGTLVIAGPTNIEYAITVWQGHTLSPDPARPGIVSENPQIVGGGVSTWTGAAHMPFSIPFHAHLIQFAGQPGQANEISVAVYPKVDGAAGAALGVIAPDQFGGGFIPSYYVSSFMIMRVRGT